MYEILNRTAGADVAIELKGALSESELVALRAYLVGLLDTHPELRLLFVTSEWKGWEDWNALWEDVDTDLRLNQHVDRLAMVGRGTLNHLMTIALKPFAHATVRWFPSKEVDEAWTWLLGE